MRCTLVQVREMSHNCHSMTQPAERHIVIFADGIATGVRALVQGM